MARLENITQNNAVKGAQVSPPNARGRIVEGLIDDPTFHDIPSDMRESDHHVIMPNDIDSLGLFLLNCTVADMNFSLIIQSPGFENAPSFSLHMWDSRTSRSFNRSQLVLFNSSHVEQVVRNNCSTSKDIESYSCALVLISSLVTTYSLSYGIIVIPTSFAPHILFSDSMRK